jgi:hypothetical protein
MVTGLSETCPAWEALLVAMLPPAWLLGSHDQTSTTATMKWRYLWGMQNKIASLFSFARVSAQHGRHLEVGSHPNSPKMFGITWRGRGKKSWGMIENKYFMMKNRDLCLQHSSF